MLMIVVAFIALYNIKNISSILEDRYLPYAAFGDHMHRIESDINKIIRATEEYDAGWMTRDDAVKRIAEERERVKEYLGKLYGDAGAADIITAGEIAEIEDRITKLYGASSKILEIRGPGSAEASVMEVFDKYAEAVYKGIQDIQEEFETAFHDSVKGSLKTVSFVVTAFSMVTVLFLVLALGVGLSVSYSISRPIAELNAAAVQIAKGDLDVHLVSGAEDELGSLAGSFNEMAASLKHLIRKEKELSLEAMRLNKELQEEKMDLERMNKHMTGRELRIIELKEEVKELKEKLAKK